MEQSEIPQRKPGPLAVMEGLFDPQTLNQLSWAPMRPGVEVVPIYGRPGEGPAAALLRYQPGAMLPYHTHSGYEHILILTNRQCDQNGCYPRGSLVVHPPGSRHTVASPDGGIALVIWEKPVVFSET